MTQTPAAADSATDPATDTAADSAPATKRGALGSMLIADLKSLAGGLGVPGAGSMKKAQLVEAIKAAQSGSSGRAAASTPPAGDEAPAAVRRTRARAAQETPKPSPVVESAASGPAETQAADVSAPVVRTRTRSRSKAPAPEPVPSDVARDETPPAAAAGDEAPVTEPGESGGGESGSTGRRRRGERRDGQGGQNDQGGQGRPDGSTAEQQGGQDKQHGQNGQDKNGQDKNGQDRQRAQKGQRGQQGGQQGGQQDQARQDQARQDREEQSRNDQARNDRARNEQAREQARNDRARDEQGDQGDDLDGGGRNRRRRGRDRERNRPLGVGPGQRSEPDTTILEDDVLVPAAGILDVLDNYAFVRTSGYLPGPDDVYVSLSMVRRFGLRRGDALVGQVRQPRDGERKEKFNPMVQIDAVNGNEPEASKNRVDFDRLTPLHPSERLRLETGPTNLVGRVIDVAAPIGKGQRGLVVSPPDAGKTELLRSIAGSITANHPECHLMVVLLDERPEEVTDFERAVNGEVISSTFDRPPGDHTAVAELAIERAKRLVELGHDVVVLLDGITRLGRAYDLAAAPHGRQLPGGLDATALHPTKRFFGSARNLENGGSLTILATASVETGSGADAAILDALTGAGNLLIRLRGDLAAQRLHPAVDAVASGTRHEELLMSQEEAAIVRKLRAELAELEPAKALGSLLERLRRTQTNIEFLMQVQRSS